MYWDVDKEITKAMVVKLLTDNLMNWSQGEEFTVIRWESRFKVIWMNLTKSRTTKALVVERRMWEIGWKFWPINQLVQVQQLIVPLTAGKKSGDGNLEKYEALWINRIDTRRSRPKGFPGRLLCTCPHQGRATLMCIQHSVQFKHLFYLGWGVLKGKYAENLNAYLWGVIFGKLKFN